MSKKVLSLLLALTLMFSMTSISAFASDPNTDIIVIGDLDPATPPTTGGIGFLTNDEDDDPDALLTCDCVVECTEDAINEDCPICATQPELCVVGVNVGVENIAPVTVAEDAAIALVGTLNGITAGVATIGVTSTTVDVIADVTIASAITVPADVTLEIVSGITNVNFSGGTGILVIGTLRVSGGKLNVNNSSSIGINAVDRPIEVTGGEVNVNNFGGTGIQVAANATGSTMVVSGSGKVKVSNSSSTTGIGINVMGASDTGSSLTVSGGGEIEINNSAGDGIKVESDCTMTVSGGTLKVNNSGGGQGIRLEGGASMAVSSGTVNVTSSSTAYSIAILDGAHMSVSNGNVNVNNTGTGSGIAVGGTVNVTGGAVSVNNTGTGTGILVGGLFKLDAATNNVTLTLNGNDKSLFATSTTKVIGANTATNTAKIAVKATAPASGALMFYSSATAAGALAVANTDYEWAEVTPPVGLRISAQYGWLADSTPPAPAPATTPSSGGGSSPSKEVKPAPPAPVVTPLDDKASGVLSSAINAAATVTSGESLGVKLRNVSNFTKANAAAIIAKAKALGKKATVSSDVMSEDGKYVEVRVTLDPALINKNVRLDGYTRASQTFITQTRFIKHFENKTAIISLGQDGKFGQTAKISARLDFKGFDQANLYLYSYDKKANKYTLITSKDYTIDRKGYLVFNTDLGGDIIVSNGKLVRK